MSSETENTAKSPAGEQTQEGQTTQESQPQKGYARQTLGAAGGTLGGIVGSAVEGVGQISTSASGDALRPVGDTLESGGEYVKSGQKPNFGEYDPRAEANHTLTSTLGNTLGAVTNTVTGVVGSAVGGLGNLVTAGTAEKGKMVGDKMSGAGAWVENGGKSVQGTLEKFTAGTTREGGQTVGRWADRGVREVGYAAESFAREFENGRLKAEGGGAAAEKMQDAAKGIEGGGQSAAESLGEVGKGATSGIGEAGKGVAGGAGDATKGASDGVEEAGKGVTSGVSDAGKTVGASVGTTGDQAKPASGGS